MTKKAKTAEAGRFCPRCEDGSRAVEKKVSIPVGAETFTVRTLVCKKCGFYALTPRVRREMDDWGRKLTKNMIEPQPVFTEATHLFAEEMATQYGLKRVPLFRVLTAFYLNHVVNREDFQELKRYCETHVSQRFLSEGRRSKVSMPIRYLLFRRLQTFSEVWDIPHAKVIEEAVLFGLAALSSDKDNLQKLQTIAGSLQQYIEDIAQAA